MNRVADPSGTAVLPPMLQRLAAWSDGAPLRFAPMEVVQARIGDRPVVFHCNMEDDPVQARHRQGEFYEADELAELAGLLPERPVVLDVGANVGNHALFFATQCGARRVLVVEPNPLALEPLVANVIGNGLHGTIELWHLGFGLSDRNEGGFTMREHDRNLGATKMFAGTGGPLKVRIGDEAFPRARPNLVKIDVEGMEMQVLRGLEKLIARARPILMVEVAHANAEDFASWVDSHGYTPHLTRKVGKANDNHILLPPSGGGKTRRGKNA